MSKLAWRRGLIVFTVLFALLLVGTFVYRVSYPHHKVVPTATATPTPTTTPTTSATPSASATATPTPTSTACSTWKISTTTPANQNWLEDGVPAIQNAGNSEQAAKAAKDWADQVKNNAGTLSGAIEVALNKSVAPDSLVDSYGCATPAAVGYVRDIAVQIALSKSITPDQAPADATNSGASDGTVYSYSQPGITGNRKSVKIVLRDGTTFWVLARCGNVATIGKPPVKQQPQPSSSPSPSSTPTQSHRPCPPGQVLSTVDQSRCVLIKDPSKDVLRNPSVPPAVKGPGTTPVGSTPSPATKPTDSTTGCNGPCPGSTASPSPTKTSSPTPTYTAPPPAPQPPPSPIATDTPVASPICTPSPGHGCF